MQNLPKPLCLHLFSTIHTGGRQDVVTNPGRSSAEEKEFVWCNINAMLGPVLNVTSLVPFHYMVSGSMKKIANALCYLSHKNIAKAANINSNI